MKRFVILLIAFMSLANVMNSQTVGHEVKFYAPEGEKFTLYVNNRAVNASPSDVVEIKKVYVNDLNIKIEFSDTTLNSIVQKNLPLINASKDDMNAPFRTVYKIVKKKKAYVLVLVKMERIHAFPKQYKP